MIPPSFVVLHSGQSMTLVEYVFRVLVYLLAFTGIGVTIFWSVRVIEIARPEISGRGGTNDSEP